MHVDLSVEPAADVLEPVLELVRDPRSVSLSRITGDPSPWHWGWVASFRDEEVVIECSAPAPAFAVDSLRHAIAFRLLEAALPELEGVRDIEEDVDQISSFVVRRSDGETWVVTVDEDPPDPAISDAFPWAKPSRVIVVPIRPLLLDPIATARFIEDAAKA